MSNPLFAKDGIAGEIEWLRKKGASPIDITKMLLHGFIVVPVILFTVMYAGISLANAFVPTKVHSSGEAMFWFAVMVALGVGMVFAMKTVIEWTDPVMKYNNAKLHEKKTAYVSLRKKYRKALKAVAAGKLHQSGTFRVVDGESVEIAEDGSARPVTY